MFDKKKELPIEIEMRERRVRIDLARAIAEDSLHGEHKRLALEKIQDAEDDLDAWEREVAKPTCGRCGVPITSGTHCFGCATARLVARLRGEVLD